MKIRTKKVFDLNIDGAVLPLEFELIGRYFHVAEEKRLELVSAYHAGLSFRGTWHAAVDLTSILVEQYGPDVTKALWAAFYLMPHIMVPHGETVG